MEEGDPQTEQARALAAEAWTEAERQIFEGVKWKFWEIVNAAKENANKGAYAAMFFVKRQAMQTCPFGGKDDYCECYPHQARRWCAGFGVDFTGGR
jgi:hypothetical protein